MSKSITLICWFLIEALLYDRQLHYRVIGHSPWSTELYTLEHSVCCCCCLGFEIKEKNSQRKMFQKHFNETYAKNDLSSA